MISYQKNIEASELNMLRKTMGLAMPLKLAMERKSVSKIGHLPCISGGGNAMLEALTGQDSIMGFDDMFGKLENFETLPDTPFCVVDKFLDDNKI